MDCRGLAVSSNGCASWCEPSLCLHDQQRAFHVITCWLGSWFWRHDAWRVAQYVMHNSSPPKRHATSGWPAPQHSFLPLPILFYNASWSFINTVSKSLDFLSQFRFFFSLFDHDSVMHLCKRVVIAMYPLCEDKFVLASLPNILSCTFVIDYLIYKYKVLSMCNALLIIPFHFHFWYNDYTLFYGSRKLYWKYFSILGWNYQSIT